MGRFSIEVFRYLESHHFRVLLAIEMGMKNHEFVPLQLVAAIASLHRGAASRTLSDLIKSNLVVYERGKRYDGYRLTNLGYDYLALRALSSREVVMSVGNQIGVGKESDVYVGGDQDTNDVVLKFHRLGRTSFRKLKEKRDYHSKRHFCSWLYLSRIAAAKEFSFLQALHSHGFPVPKPLDVNRHTVVMSLVEGCPLYQVQELKHPDLLHDKLMEMVLRLASYGLIHGDFNQFNIIIVENEEPIMIDFPQMVSIDHPNAEFYFERDVSGLRDYFRKKFHFEAAESPQFSDIQRGEHALDMELEASGFIKKQSTVDLNKAYDEGKFEAHLDTGAGEQSLSHHESSAEEGVGESTDDEDDEIEPDVEETARELSNSDEQLRAEMEELKLANLGKETEEAPKPHQQGAKCSGHSHKGTFTAEEIKNRLKRKDQITKEKLRVKGKQNAVRRAQRENTQIIKEYAGWDKY